MTQALSVDPLPYVRTQAMNLIFQLLCDKPEQEQNLLRLLVNKLVRLIPSSPSMHSPDATVDFLGGLRKNCSI